MTTAIEIKNWSAVEVTLAPECQEEKITALAKSKTVLAVADDRQQQIAVNAMKALKSLLKEVESYRKEVKGPVAELGKRIDGMAKEFCEDIEEELTRVSGIAGEYESEKQKRIAEQKKKLQAEIDRIEADRKSRQDEIDQRERTALDAARELKSIQARRAAQEAAIRESQSRQAEVKAETRAAVAELPLVSENKARGSVVRVSRKFEVMDVMALYRQRPDLVTLAPITCLINEAIRGDPMPSIAGLRIWDSTEVGVRT